MKKWPPSWVSTSTRFTTGSLKFKDLDGNGVIGRPKLFHREDSSHIPVVDENAVVSLPWLEGLNPQLEEYPNQWWMSSDYKEYFNRWPIPQTEFDNGNAFTAEDQNPGYLGQ